MTTKLEAVNLMLSCIGASQVNTLDGLKSAYTVAAETLLDSECKRVQLSGWNFNTDKFYKLTPDENNIIEIPDDIVSVNLPHSYETIYTVRNGQLYDKIKHTFTIEHSILAKVTFCFDFEDCPEVFRQYIAISAAYKFTKRELGANANCVYTKEDVQEMWATLLNYDLETGNYSFIREMHNGRIRGTI